MIPSVVNIVSVVQLGDYRLCLGFDDGSSQTIDFQPFLSGSSNPDIRAWLAPERFKAFRLEAGDLVWGDYDLCFPMIDLYRNTIDHRTAMGLAA